MPQEFVEAGNISRLKRVLNKLRAADVQILWDYRLF